MQELIFLYGPPAAGKTTFSVKFCNDNPDYIRIGADTVREELYGSQDIYGDGALIYKCLLAKMRMVFREGKNVLYDGTNLKKTDRMDFLRDLADIECKKAIWMLSVDIGTAKVRHAGRGRNIPWESLAPYFDIDEPPTKDEGWDEIKEVV